MKLSEKGPIWPVPVLMGPAEVTSQTVQAWPGVVSATHWGLYSVGEKVDGAEFHVNDADLGHIHLGGDVHLATSGALREVLVGAGLAEPFPFGGAAYASWVLFRLRTPADAAHATWLFELNYRRLCGVPEAELLTAVAAYQHPA